ncbi:hypothetical protein [Leisingera sp. F5]
MAVENSADELATKWRLVIISENFSCAVCLRRMTPLR